LKERAFDTHDKFAGHFFFGEGGKTIFDIIIEDID
jgi:hypothetical protein